MQQSEGLIDPVVLAIIIVEIVAFLFQFLYYLQRPGDNPRKLYLILLFMLLFYNITGGLVPNYDSDISLEIQFSIGHFSAITMLMYFIYYIYKVFKLEHLKWTSTKGIWYFLFVPFVVFDIVLFATGDISLAQKVLLPVPTLYGTVFVYKVTLFLIYKRKTIAVSEQGNYRIYLFSVVSAILCWLLLPIITFFQFNNIIEHVSTNLGLLFMTAVYIQSLVQDPQNEYQRLLKSEEENRELIASLEKTNALLSNTIKNREKVIQERTEDLRVANEKQRTNFINLAHETKTPLTLINNYLTGYIRRQGVDEDLTIIKYNLDKLTNDIVNYFDIERLDRGVDIYDHNQTSDFSHILINCLSLFTPLAETKDIRLISQADESLFVKADPDALVRVINNIVENAIKYTDSGGRISVILRAEASKAVLVVSDSGRGIPQYLQKKVLQPYFQASQKKTGSEGIGMGLAIVNKILEHVNGSIKLANNPVRGLRVEIVIPMKSSSGRWSEFSPTQRQRISGLCRRCGSRRRCS